MFGFLLDHPKPTSALNCANSPYLDLQNPATETRIRAIELNARLKELTIVLPNSASHRKQRTEPHAALAEILKDDQSYLRKLEDFRVRGEPYLGCQANPTLPLVLTESFGRCLQRVAFERVHLPCGALELVVVAQQIRRLEFSRSTAVIPTRCQGRWLGFSI